jgi:FAD synthetase
MTRVMVFGSFDPLHEGHRSLFRQARRHGDELIVVVARDVNIRKLKGREPREPEQRRLAIVRREPLVDDALLGDEKDLLKVILQQQPDAIILGYDQATFGDEELRHLLAERGLEPEIMRAVAFEPERYKSSRAP